MDDFNSAIMAARKNAIEERLKQISDKAITRPAVPRLENISRRIQKHIDALGEIKKLIREIWKV